MEKEVTYRVDNSRNMTKKITWTDAQKAYGDLMLLDTFSKAVESRFFTDYDGFGHYATGIKVSNITIKPSEFHRTKVPHWATHIMWYNR